MTDIIIFLDANLNETSRVESDVTFSESHDQSSTASEIPVEDGSVISDNIKVDPEKLSINIFISNAPLSPHPEPDFPAVVFNRIRESISKKQLVSIQTSKGFYKEVRIESQSAVTAPRSGTSLNTTLRIKTILTAVSKSTKIPITAFQNPNRSKGTSDQDNNGKKDPSNEQNAAASLTVGVLDFFAGTVDKYGSAK